MTEIDFAKAGYFGEFTIKGNEITAKYCPFCQGGQHKDKETFSLNTEKHIYKCLRGSCGASGHFSELCREKGIAYTGQEQIFTPKVKREYKKPNPVAVTDAGMEYMNSRKIAAETAKAFGVGGNGKGEIVFPFFENMEQFKNKTPTFIKYRPAHKLQRGEHKARREKDTKPILFGMHLCNPDLGRLTIFEGEFDAMAGYQAGGVNCVSVPSGCQEFTWLETCSDFLNQFSTVAIMADNDEAGRKMLRELSLKLECLVLRPDFEKYQGCKDSNEILFRYGEAVLKSIMGDMHPVEVLGLLNLSEVQSVNIKDMPRTLSGIPMLDRMTGGLFEGDLNVWTGKRGEGKSTLITQLLLESIEQGYNVCAYSGEVPASRFKHIVLLQAAGTNNVMDYEDSLAERVNQYVPKEHQKKIEAWLDGRFWLYDNQIAEADEAESVLRVFEQAYRRYNCKVFLVDNLMTVRTHKRESDMYQMQADFTIKLRKLAEKLGAVIHLVVHPRKVNGTIKDSDDVGGLGTITNIACNVFSVARVPDNVKQELDCDAVVSCLKNRWTGTQGDIKLDYHPRSRRLIQCKSTEKTFSWIKETIDDKPMEEPPF